MEIKTLFVKQKRVAVIYHDGKPIAKWWIAPQKTGEEIIAQAIAFADSHPDLFPGRAEAQEKFDRMFGE